MIETGRADLPLTKRLAEVVGHPLRCFCLVILTERTASPIEIAHQLGKSVTDVSYHIKRLVELKAVEEVSCRHVRGAVEHFYRAIHRPEIGDEEYSKFTLEERLAFGQFICQLAFADMAISMNEKTFAQRPDHHVVRFPVTVDEEGWDELTAIYEHAYNEVYEVTKRAALRHAEHPGSQAIQVRVAAFVFEMPPDVTAPPGNTGADSSR